MTETSNFQSADNGAEETDDCRPTEFTTFRREDNQTSEYTPLKANNEREADEVTSNITSNAIKAVQDQNSTSNGLNIETLRS